MRESQILTLADYALAYREGATTPTRMVAETYRRIAAHADPAIFITLRPESELHEDAAQLESRGPEGMALYGVPVVIKDNIDVSGVPTTAACREFAYTPERDATAVARLRAAGALIVGKTNLDQFATGLVGTRSPYGVPRNTFRADLVPGGSSSGSAVAVAAGLVPLALGTDTAGSGRVPAGLNNIVGLKPTLGAIPTTGLVPACRTLDCVSIFALTVADAEAALRVLAGYDDADPYARRVTIGHAGDIPPGLRFGYPDHAGLTFAGDAFAQSAFEAALGAVATYNAQAVDISVMEKAAALLYDGPWVAERYQAIRGFLKARASAVLPVTRAIIERANGFSAADAFAGRYALARLQRDAEQIWRAIDVLVVPTMPRPRSLADITADPLGPNAELGTYTNFVNLLDLCALAIPGPLRADGLPSGVTLLAPAGRDALLASVGQWLHARLAETLGATGRPLPLLPAPSTRSAAGDIELAVVGAHLSGLPLNHELTTLGGRFLRAVRTTPDYRLFALPGGPPYRPGLLRIGDGGGHAIETEVWALNAAAFGTFVSGVPAPLAIGTLTFADGTRTKGFLVEQAGTMGAEDISVHGGWRAFLRTRAA